MRVVACNLVLAVLALGSCGRARLSPGEYIAWMQDPENGLVQTHETGDFRITAQFKTPDYILLKEHRKGDAAQIDDSAWAIAAGSYAGLCQFTLQLTGKERGEFLGVAIQEAPEYYERIQYYTDLVVADLALVVAQDTIPCAISLFERTYGAAPFDNLLIGFSGLPASVLQGAAGDIELIHTDRVLGIGTLSFKFNALDLQDQPILVRS